MLLIAILMPSLARAREQSRRVVCASRVRQLDLLCVTYANEYKGVLPSGKRDNLQEHTPFVSSVLHDYIMDQAGAMPEPTPQRGPTGFYEQGRSPMLDCPNYLDGHQDRQVRYLSGSQRLGWVIGYQYLGSHPGVEKFNRDNPLPGSPNGRWETAYTLADRATSELFTDYNNWSPGGWVFVAHTANGALRIGSNNYYNYAMQGIRPEDAGSEGGNVGHLDGSVQWKNIGDMTQYYTSVGFGFPALW